MSYTHGYDSDGNVTIAAGSGTDALSGIDASSRSSRAGQLRSAEIRAERSRRLGARFRARTRSSPTRVRSTAPRLRPGRQRGDLLVGQRRQVRHRPARHRHGRIGDRRRPRGHPQVDAPAGRGPRHGANPSVARRRVAGSGASRQDVELQGPGRLQRRYVLVQDPESRQGGNQSAGVRTATPRSPYLLSPRDGAVLRRPPLLDWRPLTGATYYNVQLWRNGVKILSRHPSVSQFRLSARWTYNGRSYRLGAGRYRWFVWLGLRQRSAAEFGRLRGYSDFTVPR